LNKEKKSTNIVYFDLKDGGDEAINEKGYTFSLCSDYWEKLKTQLERAGGGNKI